LGSHPHGSAVVDVASEQDEVDPGFEAEGHRAVPRVERSVAEHPCELRRAGTNTLERGVEVQVGQMREAEARHAASTSAEKVPSHTVAYEDIPLEVAVPAGGREQAQAALAH
jgi:hypothetical protein